ncbi:hypothetical protein FS749_003294 [Ceratobasidium sp. UAMH 11750]|nr:hypothetical protein FS749_003294 [Ceratobasidium sp. UAMH 11750]
MARTSQIIGRPIPSQNRAPQKGTKQVQSKSGSRGKKPKKRRSKGGLAPYVDLQLSDNQSENEFVVSRGQTHPLAPLEMLPSET